MTRANREAVDLDALQQRVADLETLLTSPGWQLLSAQATTLYGQRMFAETMAALTRGGHSAQTVGERALAVIAAREAALAIMQLPSQMLDEAKRKVAAAQAVTRAASRAPFGPTVEMSQ